MNGRSDSAGQGVYGFVLAGGRSSRMGADKALVEVQGKPLIAHALRILRETGVSGSIAGARSDLSHDAPVVPDKEPDLGPLSGICAALSATAAPYALFLPVDLPLMSISLLGFMARHAQTTGALFTLASINGFPQTFPIVIRAEALPALLNELHSGNRGCYRAFQVTAQQNGESISILSAEYLLQCGHIQPGLWYPAMRWFQNVNTRDDLDRVSSLLAQAVA